MNKDRESRPRESKQFTIEKVRDEMLLPTIDKSKNSSRKEQLSKELVTYATTTDNCSALIETLMFGFELFGRNDPSDIAK